MAGLPKHGNLDLALDMGQHNPKQPGKSVQHASEQEPDPDNLRLRLRNRDHLFKDAVMDDAAWERHSSWKRYKPQPKLLCGPVRYVARGDSRWHSCFNTTRHAWRVVTTI